MSVEVISEGDNPYDENGICYRQNDLVSRDGVVYSCILAHKSSKLTTPGLGVDWKTKWMRAADMPETGNHIYDVDDEAEWHGVVYICIKRHSSLPHRAPETGANWREFWIRKPGTPSAARGLIPMEVLCLLEELGKWMGSVVGHSPATGKGRVFDEGMAAVAEMIADHPDRREDTKTEPNIWRWEYGAVKFIIRRVQGCGSFHEFDSYNLHNSLMRKEEYGELFGSLEEAQHAVFHRLGLVAGEGTCKWRAETVNNGEPFKQIRNSETEYQNPDGI